MAEARLRWREMLPIVARELQVASKRRTTYRLRLAVAGLGALVLLVAANIPATPAQAGRVIFWAVSGVMILVCGGAGFILTADAISREKREGTLGLLFLTRLGGADVVLGKLAAGAINGGSVAFAALPFLAFSLCLGGITGGDFWTMSGLLIFLLTYSLTLGIFLSALLRSEALISFLFCALMILPAVLTPLAIVKLASVPAWLAQLNPFYPAMATMDRWAAYFPHEAIGQALRTQALEIVAMIGGASLILPWMVRMQPAKRALMARLEPPVLTRVRAAARGALLDANPVLWLSQRQNKPLLLLWICAGLWAAMAFFGASAAGNELTYVFLLAFLPKLFVLWHASGMMAAERRSGFLEALLTTPLPSSEVLQGKVRAIKRQIAPALLFAMIIQWAVATSWFGSARVIDDPTTLLLASMLTLLIDIHAIAWIGLWQGLGAGDRRRALVRSILWGVVAPWVPGMFVFGAIFALFEPKWMGDPVNVIGPLVISVNVSIVGIACLAMARLHEKFRSTATQTWSGRQAN